MKDGQRRIAGAAREVILAGGAVNSPHLLMLSGIGPAQDLSRLGIGVVRDLPGVGRDPQDHLAVAVIVGSKQPITLVAAESYGNLLKFLLLRKGMLTSNAGGGAGLRQDQYGCARSGPRARVRSLPLRQPRLTKQSRHGLTIGAVLLQPRSVGSISLRSLDPLKPPLIQPNYLSDRGGVGRSVTG